jgi:hypothetical protein
LHIRSLIWVALLSILGTVAVAQTQPLGTASACASCHHAQVLAQPQTPMGRALMLPPANPVLRANPKLSVQRGPYNYSIETQGDKSTYTVTDGKRIISWPVSWNFGTGVQAWIFPRDGKYYESLVSYYPAIGGLDLTVGDEQLKPQTLEEAAGRELKEKDIEECLGCHATNAVSKGKLTLDSFEPGVTCEHCHAGASNHVLDASNGRFDSAPPSLSKLSAEDISNFCGQCHRTWETVVRNHWRGEANVRFAPYRLANSKCFSGTDPRISCIACHDPHQELNRQASSYDSKCLACHASQSNTGAAKADVAATKSCPVAKSECTSCHMPKVKLPDENVTFSDHQIRIVKAGDPYPN